MNKILWLVVLFTLGIASLARAQSGEANAPAQAHTAAVSQSPTKGTEGLIKLDVLVVDGHGMPVADLKPADFSLFENGQEQRILSFQEVSGLGTGSEPSIQIILLIDTLGMPGFMAEEESSAVQTYLRKRNGQLGHPVSVYLLDNSGLRTVAPSSDGDVLASEIEHNNATMVRPVERRPALGGGQAEGSLGLPESPFLSATKALGQIATYERTKPGRKLLVWVGPRSGTGSANYNEWTMTNAQGRFYFVRWFSTLLREARLALFDLSVGEPTTQSILPDPRAYLKSMASPQQVSLLNLSRDVLAVQSGGAVMNTLDPVPQIAHCVQQAGPFY